MTDILTCSAEQILAIPKLSPEKLFSFDGFELEFKRLRGKWHPDVCNDKKAQDVFVHINELAEVARLRIESKTWAGRASLTFTVKDKTYRFKYIKQRQFELGNIYVAEGKVAYVIDSTNGDLFKNGIQAIKGLKYPDPKMKAEFERYLPKIEFEGTADIGNVLVISKPTNAIILQDLLDYVPNKRLDPKHAAWVVSALYNITTFLDYTGVCHNAILPSTVFVDPKNHAIYLLGGWWYSTKKSEKLIALPSEVMKTVPSSVLKDKVAISNLDRKAVKGIGLACLGDSSMTGSRLLSDKSIPPKLLAWLRSPSDLPAIDEFTGWYNTIHDVFGKRKFVELNINATDVY